MPASVYLLMALEASRQLFQKESGAGYLRLSNIHFDQALPLSAFRETDTMVEVQLIAWQLDKANDFVYEIHNLSLRSGHVKVDSRVKSPEFCSFESSIEINGCGKGISLGGLRYQVAKKIHQKATLSSLFFKPVLLPDITRLSGDSHISISRRAELLTHK